MAEITPRAALDRICTAVVSAGSQSAYARKLNVAPNLVNMVVNARMKPTPAMLADVGLTRRVVIEEARQ